MREVWLIWRAWFWSIRNTILGKRVGKGARGGALGLAVMVFVGYLVFSGMTRFLAFARGNLPNPPNSDQLWRILCLNLAASLALASFLFLFMTALGTVMANFLEGKGLAFLLAQPLRPRTVFTAKFGESLGSMVLGLLPVILPSWLAMGLANHAPAWFYLLVLLSFLCGAVLFLGPVVVLMLLVLRYIPRQRARQIVMILSLLTGLLFVFGTQFLNSVAARMRLGSPAWLTRLAVWSIARASCLPHSWMARTPMAALGWPGLQLAPAILPLVASAVAVFCIANALAARIFLAGWSVAQESGAVPKHKPGTPARAVLPSTRFTGSFFGLLRKDLALARREPMLWYNLAVSVIVVGFFVWNITSIRHGREPAPEWLGTFYAVLIVSCTTGWTSQIGGVSISREGESWWLLQVAPGSSEQIYAAKLVFAFLPQLAFVLLASMVLAVMAKIPGFSLWYGVLVGSALALGIASLSLLFDALAPNFHLRLDSRWSGGRNVGASKVVATTLLSLAVVVVFGTTLALPAFYRFLPSMDWLTVQTARLLGRILFLAEILLTLAVSWSLGVARLRRLLQEGAY